jgi:hypothetical protein
LPCLDLIGLVGFGLIRFGKPPPVVPILSAPVQVFPHFMRQPGDFSISEHIFLPQFTAIYRNLP